MSAPPEGVEIRQIFEYELKRKLSMRAKTSTSEMMLLMNAFRFYDINNSGTCNKDEWVKVFGKIGLNGFTDKDLIFLFDVYDVNSQGVIKYKDFTAYLYDQPTSDQASQQNKPSIISQAKPITPLRSPPQEQQYQPPQRSPDQFQQPPQRSPDQFQQPPQRYPDQTQQQQAYQQPPQRGPEQYQQQNYQQQSQRAFQQEYQMQTPLPNLSQPSGCSTPLRFEVKKYFRYLLDVIRSFINTRHGITYYTFASRIKTYEDQLRKTITFEDFYKCFGDVQVNIEQKIVKDFFNLLDVCDEGSISTAELLRLIRGTLSERRKMMIVQIFAGIDIDRRGYYEIDKLKNLYNADGHPDALKGKSPAEIFEEFSYTFDIFVNIKEKAGVISFEDFIEYYHGISACYERDEDFAQLMNGVWAPKREPSRRTPLNQVPPRQPTPQRNPTPLLNQSQQQPRRTPLNQIPQQEQPPVQQIPQQQNIIPQQSSRRQTPSISQSQVFQPSQNASLFQNGSQSRRARGPSANNQIRYNPINNTYVLPGEQPVSSLETPSNLSQKNPPSQSPVTGAGININRPPEPQNDSAYQAVLKLRQVIKLRGTKGIFGIQRLFRLYDKTKSGQIDVNQFSNLCSAYRYNLSQQDIDALFAYFDNQNTGKINYDEVVRAVVGNMNNYRQNLVKRVFASLDRTGSGVVEANDIKNLYNSSRHPEVVSGKRTEEEVLGEWLDNLETFNEYNGTLTRDRKVTLDEFMNYYNQISMSIDDDRYFEYTINNVWDMDKKPMFSGYNNLPQENYNTRARTGSQIIQGNAGFPMNRPF